MQFWSIGDIARQTNVPASTIRYYEEIQLLPPAEKVNGRRRYDHAILPQLTLIRLAQQAGFTIAEIQTLLHDFPADATPSARWQVMAQQKLNELDERLKVIEAMKAILVQTLACQCETLAECGVGIDEYTAVTVNC
jgi:MerR family redox-sensitive transcriptional activator SoxR